MMATACAMLVAILYLVVAGIFFFDPVQKTRNAHQYMQVLTQAPYCRYGIHAVRALTGLAGLALISPARQAAGSGFWIDWASLLGVLGFGSMVVSHSRALFCLPVLIREYQAVEQAVKPAVARQLSLVLLDPRGWVEIGGVAVWALVVTLAARDRLDVHSSVVAIAVAFAVLSVVNVFAWVSQRYSLVSVTTGAALMILAPSWFIWLGTTM